MFDLLDKAMGDYIIKGYRKRIRISPIRPVFGYNCILCLKIILRKNSKPLYNFYKVIFLVYLFALVHIILFEREPGSRTAQLAYSYLKHWEVPRNNAYVVENVLCLSHMVFYLRFFSSNA